jgi:hypothetical protein
METKLSYLFIPGMKHRDVVSPDNEETAMKTRPASSYLPRVDTVF